ncbi:hypothetical protein [Frankia sp. CiP1_Cm_nod1]|uniref:hypothetical protein n=1 Tax=Frankia sp. CiP1_Cm_nod1 TaxID=2897160 RepID=UPI0020246F30
MTVTRAAGVREDCYSCVRNVSLDALPPRERILLGPGWRVVHAIRAALPGWLVAVARRHVTSPAELTAADSANNNLPSSFLRRPMVGLTAG